MFDAQKITRVVRTPQMLPGTGQVTNLDLGGWTAGHYSDSTRTPPQYANGHGFLVKGELLTAPVRFSNNRIHDIGRNTWTQDRRDVSLHVDAFYVRNTKPSGVILFDDNLIENIAGGAWLIEAGCAGRFEFWRNECRNIGYPSELIVKPTTPACKIELVLDGNLGVDVQIDTSKLASNVKVGDCLEVWIGSNVGKMPDFAALGVRVNRIGTATQPAPVPAPDAECQASLRLCQTTLKNTEAEVVRLNGVVAAMTAERDALAAKIARALEDLR